MPKKGIFSSPGILFLRLHRIKCLTRVFTLFWTFFLWETPRKNAGEESGGIFTAVPRLSSLSGRLAPLVAAMFSVGAPPLLGVPRSSASRDAFLDSSGTPPQSISAPRLLPVEVLTNTPSCDIIQSKHTKRIRFPLKSMAFYTEGGSMPSKHRPSIRFVSIISKTGRTFLRSNTKNKR